MVLSDEFLQKCLTEIKKQFREGKALEAAIQDVIRDSVPKIMGLEDRNRLRDLFHDQLLEEKLEEFKRRPHLILGGRVHRRSGRDLAAGAGVEDRRDEDEMELFPPKPKGAA